MPTHIKGFSLQQIWETVSSKLVHFVERIFFRFGVVVALYPWRTIILTWCFILLSCVGLLKFHMEKNPLKLWVPPDSDFYYDTNWYVENFGTAFRLQKVLITADNVLEPDVLIYVHDIVNRVNSIQVDYENKKYTMNNLCFKVPIVNFFTSSRKSRSTENASEKTNNNQTQIENRNSDNKYSDPTLWVDDTFYCSFLETFPLTCLQENILDIWKNDIDLIRKLSKHDIITKINEIKINPLSGHPSEYSKHLGGVKHDDSGQIVAAKSLLLTWYTYVDMTAVDMNTVGNLVGTEDWVSVPLALWESQYLELFESLSHNFTNLNIYYEAGRSFADISGETIYNELDKLFLGISIMSVYVIFALSRFNWLEIRLTLGSVGMLSVGMAYISSVSWCSILGISFGPVHSSLPFLLMGLGIDDMFVMDACWRNLSEKEMKKSLPTKVGLMLKHAGVSIVITSFTDIVALLIGAITILPSLKSFCIYAAMGVFFIFCYTVTFYVAVFTFDLRRIENNRNGIFFCYTHKKNIKTDNKKSVLQKLFETFYQKIIFSIPGKSIVFLFTILVTGFSIHGILQLEQRFDPKWFIPSGTYFKSFIDTYDRYYPEEGYNAMVFLGKMDYKEEFKQLHDIVQDLKSQKYVKNIDSWVDSFHGYVLNNYNHNLLNTSEVTDSQFNSYLSRFLFSPIGGRYLVNFVFAEEIHCGKPASLINASSISFAYKKFQGPEEYIPAMNSAKHIVKSANFSSGDGYRSVWAKSFANWVTDEIIGVEVERNIELALLCVMMCTIVLITNLQMCLWIFICVLLTLINVLGFMQRWGMTVDIVCCIGLELAIGLCVDYAAHVAHTFLTISGASRQDRALKTVTSIGTAVLLGGGSTFLSLSLLSVSKAYTFQSFFKIFLLVITFGLFNGLIFLPVVLSLVGPASHKVLEIVGNDKDTTMELNGTKALELQ